jgi:hypothetical protein
LRRERQPRGVARLDGDARARVRGMVSEIYMTNVSKKRKCIRRMFRD